MAIPDFSYAFQPVYDISAMDVRAYEALVRGPSGESAGSVLASLTHQELLAFDAIGRERAIDIAAGLGIRCHLNLNFLAGSLDIDEGVLDATVAHALTRGLSCDQLVIEISESESVGDHRRFLAATAPLREQGVRFSLDDFGAGYSGLTLLAEFQPETIKLDLTLVRGIECNGPRQAIVRGVIRTSEDLGIDVVAEGVETREEFEWLHDEGVMLYQGYLFAPPGFECLPQVVAPPSSVTSPA